MSGTLALAASIAAMNRDQVEHLLATRRPPSSAGDPLSLAGELLRVDSISRAVSRLPRESLSALGGDPPVILHEVAESHAHDGEILRLAPLAQDDEEAGEITRDLLSVGLLGIAEGEPVRLPEVTAVLEALLGDRGVELTPSAGQNAMNRWPTDAQATNRGDDEAHPDPDTSHWYAQALTAVSHLAECLRALARQPGRLNRNGSLAVATARVLADTASITERDAMLALTTLRQAGMLDEHDREFAPSPRGTLWLSLAHVERWIEIATTAIAAMPAPLVSTRREHLAAAVASLPERFPLLPEAELEAARASLEQLEYLGLAVQGHLTAPALALLGGPEAAGDTHRLASRDMPQSVPGVYVQPDLSVVVPGPLLPEDEALLARLSELEQPGVASTRRITEATLQAAFERGLSADEAGASLARLSLTGVPQPLEYLLTAAGQRAGSISLQEHHGDEGRTLITVSRPAIADTLLADRALQHLQLQRIGDTELVARLRADHALAALSDARHPATLTAASESASAPTPAPAPAPIEAAPLTATLDIAEQASRIIEAGAAAPGDFTRRLELAIRDRACVDVTVDIGGGSAGIRTFTVLPMSLDAGRLRALDQAADVERTLPVNLITAVD